MMNCGTYRGQNGEHEILGILCGPDTGMGVRHDTAQHVIFKNL
jgi:hypothetical protein